jgi:Fur family transcriptional regulator, ferric uptake regulator
MTSTDIPQSRSNEAAPNLRPTKQRTAVTAALSNAREFRTAQEIHDLIQAGGTKVGLATVYRTLSALADVGAVDVLRREDGEAVYRQCIAETHHHHLVCRECGSAVEIAGAAVEAWAHAVAAEHGYADISHSFELFGTCPDCAA